MADRVARWRAAPDLAADLIPADTLETERVFWFRWITGHQTTFILWQLLAPCSTSTRRRRPARSTGAGRTPRPAGPAA